MLHILAVDDKLVDHMVIERLLKISSCKGDPALRILCLWFSLAKLSFSTKVFLCVWNRCFQLRLWRVECVLFNICAWTERQAFRLKLELMLFFSDPCCTRCKLDGFKLKWVRYYECLFSENFDLIDMILIQIWTFYPSWLPLDIARTWRRHWLEQLLASSFDTIVPKFSHECAQHS